MAEETPVGAYAFGDSPEMADALLAQVLSGAKTATCGALAAYLPKGMVPPCAGERWLIVDGRDREAAEIELTEVTIRRFRDVPEEFARAEGADDHAAWRRAHVDYFVRNGGFDEDMAVVCERFRLVRAIKRKG